MLPAAFHGLLINEIREIINFKIKTYNLYEFFHLNAYIVDKFKLDAFTISRDIPAFWCPMPTHSRLIILNEFTFPCVTNACQIVRWMRIIGFWELRRSENRKFLNKIWRTAIWSVYYYIRLTIYGILFKYSSNTQNIYVLLCEA